MPGPDPFLTSDQKKLLKYYSRLDPARRSTLLAFAEFLAARAGEENPSAVAGGGPPPEPRTIPRPQQESVVSAIKRLSASYHMLDPSVLLNDTSTLMSAHVMQGRDAPGVIDDLEALFEEHYARFLESLD